MEKSKCIICNSAYKKSKIDGLLECQTCHFITTDISVSDEILKDLYSKHYFLGNEYGDYLSDKKVIQKNFNKRINTLLSHVKDSKEKKLFEIGCAYGFFLEVAKKYFKTLKGIDISDDATKYAREVLKLDACSGNFLEKEMDSKYDIFCMWDTIEHIKDPHLFIEKISKNINGNGLLAITTGDIGSMNAKLRGKKWRQIHPPTHLHYFSKNTLAKLLENNGFKIVSIQRPGSYMSLSNIFYIILLIRNHKPKIYNFLKRTGLLRINIYLNLFDFLYIIARKSDKQ